MWPEDSRERFVLPNAKHKVTENLNFSHLAVAEGRKSFRLPEVTDQPLGLGTWGLYGE